MNLLTRMVAVCAVLCSSFAHSINSISTAREYANQEYTFYDNKHKVLAKFPKALMYRLSKVIAKSANFGDHAEFIITLSNKPGDSRFQLSRESWELLLKYLQAHEREWQSDENKGAVYQALQDIGKAREIVVLDLLYFSCRYQFEELQYYLMPYVVSIWRNYQAHVKWYQKKKYLKSALSKIASKLFFDQNYNYMNNQIKPVDNLEEFVDKLFYSKNVFRKVLSNNKDYYPCFYFFTKDVIVHKAFVTSVAISKNNKFIVSASGDRTVKLYDIMTGVVKDIIFHADIIEHVIISDDSRFVVSASRDRSVKLYDTLTYETRTVITHNNWVYNIAISHNSKFIASASRDGTVKLYDITKKKIKEIIHEETNIECVAISNDERFVVSGSYNGTVKLYDRAKKTVSTIITHTSGVRSVAISHDSKFIVSGSYTGMVSLYDIDTKKVRTIIHHDGTVCALIISSDNMFVVSGSWDGDVKVYDRVTKKTKTVITHNKWVCTIALSSDNRFIVSGSYGEYVTLYDRVLGKVVKDIITHTASVRSLAISNNNRFIVSGSGDGTVKLAGDVATLSDTNFFKLIEDQYGVILINKI